MSARDLIAELARQFAAEDNAAFDLWSWLPSHRRASKAHGDYASEYRPSIASLLYEATLVLSGTSDAKIAEYLDEVGCSCGEVHEDVGVDGHHGPTG